MKSILCLLSIIIINSTNLIAQAGTEIYLFNLVYEDGRYDIMNPVNISNNPGYDNQPSFSADGSYVLFSATRNNQTDVRKYDIDSGESTWLTNTEGSEYSPTVMPDGLHFSAINLKPNGEQLLWKYAVNSSNDPEVIVPDLVIGYHSWFNRDTLITFVLGDSETPSTLQLNDIKNSTNEILYENPGRSIHSIPSPREFYKNSMSYVSKQNDSQWTINALNMRDLSSSVISSTIDNSEDMAWTNIGDIIMGSGSKLYALNPINKMGWIEIADLKQFGLTGITRIAISPNGDKLCIVVEETQ